MAYANAMSVAMRYLSEDLGAMKHVNQKTSIAQIPSPTYRKTNFGIGTSFDRENKPINIVRIMLKP
jgi:hypothetical protein